MVDEILAAMLWRWRLALRAGPLRALAGHGYVDPSYRPPALPYASVVGPLSLAVEPEREGGRAGQGLVRVPGHVIGAVRPGELAPPGAGALRLRFDGRATVTLALAGLPAAPFGDPATGLAIAAAIRAALAAAAAAGEVLDGDGAPIADPAVLAAVGAATARWSPERRQLAISSDAAGDDSSVEVLPVAGDLAPALGLAPPALIRGGRRHFHRLPPPRAMTVEVRLDLWTASQGELAAMFDGLAAGTPTRGKLVLRPSLLAADVADGATTLRLLDAGEPTTPASLAHLEGGDGLIDRARGAPFAATAPAAHEPAARRFRIGGAGRIAGVVHRAPLVPDALFATDPAPLGLACALGLALDPGSADGDVYRLFSIARGAANVLSAELVIRLVAAGQPPVEALFGELAVTADVIGAGGAAAPAETRWRIPLAMLEAGGTLHARLAADTGAIELWFDGAAQRLDDPLATPAAPVAAGPGRTAAGTDLTVALGGATPQPRPFTVTHLHLLREPVGPIDPRLRASLARAAQLRPGDVIAVAASRDGWQADEARGLAVVVAASGDELTLSRPIAGGFARGGALVFADECFFYQTALKRRDDLMNRLYHCSVDYKVSAELEDPAARMTAPLVLTTHEDVRAQRWPEPSPDVP